MSVDLEKYAVYAIQTKEDLLLAIDGLSSQIAIDEEIGPATETEVNSLRQLTKDFKSAVENADIPRLSGAFRYEATLVDTSMFLEVLKCEDATFDEECHIESSMDQVDDPILSVEVPFIPLSDFAAMHGVKDATVRQWIRRGKLRSAEKRHDGWYVANTAYRPKRGFVSGTYYWNRDEGDLSSEFPFPNGTCAIEIDQEGHSANECIGRLLDKNNRETDRLALNQLSRERLERGLIASPNVTFQGTFVRGLSEKVTPDYSKANIYPDAYRFLSEQELPEDTRALLELILPLENSAELFEQFINALGKRGDFKKFMDAN